MRTTRHIIWNVEPQPYLWNWLRANIMFQVAVTPVRRRDSLLSYRDYERAMNVIRIGDIVCVGQKRRMSHWFIRGHVTHAALYVGDGKCVHVFADGVEEVEFAEFFGEYDVMVIARPKHSGDDIQKVMTFARSKIGMPFDYSFSGMKRDVWYCSKFVQAAYAHAGVSLCRETSKHFLLPTALLQGNVSIVFESPPVPAKHFPLLRFVRAFQ